jgi:hypothetical protein
MNPFTRNASTHSAELKAVVSAILISGLFIIFLTIVHPPTPGIRKVSHHNVTIPAPILPSELLEASQPLPPVGGAIETFRVVPENFKQFDFKNHSYGPYSFPNGREIDLTLHGSDLILPDRSGWFSLRDVYYTDVTGDRKAEAIVRLSHVKCGGACDGGADLFYIYSARNGKLKPIWRYETGSYGYGCGLKSFIVTNKQLVVELFGLCPKQATDYLGTSKFIVKDLTFILFEFDGRRFAQKSIEFFATSSASVKSYEPTIRIF